MKNFMFVLIDKTNTVIWAYKITANDRTAALNEFAQHVVNDINLQFDINNTARIDIGEIQ